MILWVQQEAGYSLTSLATVGFQEGLFPMNLISYGFIREREDANVLDT
jgi:hypothetical protein